MKTRRIQAKDMQSALREVRRTLGIEAVILGTRELDDGVEIIAATGFAGLGNGSSQTHQGDFSSTLQAERQIELESRIARSRKRRINTATQRTLGQIDVLNISQDLSRLGLSSDVRKALLQQLKPGTETPWLNAPALLAQTLPGGKSKLLEEGGRIALLGCTGVGKTTTIAKLSAHFARRHGADQIALINTDCFRIGAAEQLNRYAKLIGVEVHQLQDARNLGTLLKKLYDKRLVLIDTAGNSHENSQLLQQLRLPGADCDPVESYLALSYNTQTAALERTVRQFARLDIKGAILTKSDEAVSMGAALSIVLRHQLAVAFVTTGLRVPADIRIQSAGQLTRQAFMLMAASPEYSDNQADNRADNRAFTQQQAGIL